MEDGWDVGKLIESYRRRLDKELGIPDGQDFDDFLAHQVGGFRDGMREDPVDASEFLSFCDCSNLIEVLKPVYERFNVVEKRLEPRVKFAALVILKGHGTIMGAYSDMRSHSYIWQNLGFDRLPNYELLREFVNERLPPVLDRLNDALVVELGKELEGFGIILFEKVSEDGVDIRARDSDEEAEYSGYYKEYGYKEDIVVDVDLGIPYRPIHLGINDHEGSCFPEQIRRLTSLGFHPKEWMFDGGYTSYENIAIGEAKYHTKLSYQIEKDWIFNEKGTPEDIDERYQRYWKDPEFSIGAPIQFKLRFLLDKGDTEYVGAYFRNQAMIRFEEDPENYLKNCHLRNRSESTNGHLKNQLGLEKNVPKGEKRVKRHAAMCILTNLLVALTRAQNGKTSNLVSTAYLT
jgi:hypothetical protein